MDIIVELLSTFIRVLLVDILMFTVLYWIGWTVCKVITLGKYPIVLEASNKKKNNMFVSFVGLITVLTILLPYIYWG